MGNKRKRPVNAATTSNKPISRKRLCLDAPRQGSIDHPTLRHFYPHILTLRDWLISQLPNTASKSRLRRIDLAGQAPIEKPGSASQLIEQDAELAFLLDNTLVCLDPAASCHSITLSEQDLVEYSQRVSSTRASAHEDCSLHQSDVSLIFFPNSTP